ncbi:hypothetical protein SAMN02745121_04091 [Nannocystis exedens]|uniref:Uncharacterized protein n=1 Tax=Nannocystis exedens TaxID=54 RepID=A0A1I2A6U8_9BACT|nr:hypothetical protein NAEX_02691 [Nannocystis exedens]SFE39469.1 hypothetical protein SAMN02745121_04091 [Nannocystis exedens]
MSPAGESPIGHRAARRSGWGLRANRRSVRGAGPAAWDGGVRANRRSVPGCSAVRMEACGRIADPSPGCSAARNGGVRANRRSVPGLLGGPGWRPAGELPIRPDRGSVRVADQSLDLSRRTDRRRRVRSGTNRRICPGGPIGCAGRNQRICPGGPAPGGGVRLLRRSPICPRGPIHAAAAPGWPLAGQSRPVPEDRLPICMRGSAVGPQSWHRGRQARKFAPSLGLGHGRRACCAPRTWPIDLVLRSGLKT